MTGIYDMAASDKFQGYSVGSLVGRSFYDVDANYGGTIDAISWPASSSYPLAHLANGESYSLAAIVPHLS